MVQGLWPSEGLSFLYNSTHSSAPALWGWGEGVIAGLPFLLVEEFLLRPLPRVGPSCPTPLPPTSTHSPRFPIQAAWKLKRYCAPRLLLLETPHVFFFFFWTCSMWALHSLTLTL